MLSSKVMLFLNLCEIVLKLFFYFNQPSGTTIEACKPIVNNNNNLLLGVGCISFLTNEFFREDWSNTEDSYWFLIKQNGVVFF